MMTLRGRITCLVRPSVRPSVCLSVSDIVSSNDDDSVVTGARERELTSQWSVFQGKVASLSVGPIGSNFQGKVAALSVSLPGRGNVKTGRLSLTSLT